jgi:hypothetical protein
MMISDVIVEAKSKHEIFFLLTSYVESLRFCDIPASLPEDLTRLPLTGMGDLRSKLETINAELAKPCETNGKRIVLNEAADILAAALARLQWLTQKENPAYLTEHLLELRAG